MNSLHFSKQGKRKSGDSITKGKVSFIHKVFGTYSSVREAFEPPN